MRLRCKSRESFLAGTTAIALLLHAALNFTERSRFLVAAAPRNDKYPGCPLLSRGLGGARLACLLFQTLPDDTHALLLVRIRRTQRAHVGGNLPDQALISTSNRDVRLLLDSNLYPLRNRELDRMRIAEREDDRFAFDFSAVTNADDVELFLESLCDALDRI